LAGKDVVVKKISPRRRPVYLVGFIQFAIILVLIGFLQWGCDSKVDVKAPNIAVFGAEDDSASTLPGTPVTIDVLANDESNNGWIESHTQAVDDSANEQPNSVQEIDDQLEYTPPDSFMGVATFTYTLKDESGDTDDATVTVTVGDSATLSVSKYGDGSGTVTSNPTGIDCGADCQHDYLLGTVVNLLAEPDSGSRFTGWSGDEDCADSVVTMHGDRNCTASFVLGVSGLSTLTFEVTGDGAVGSQQGGLDCPPLCSETYLTSANAVIFAVIGDSAETVTWGGDCVEFGQLTEFILFMDSDKNCTATFE
jgi:hypothetical protein